MENIPFGQWVAGDLTVLQKLTGRTDSTHSKGEGRGGKCLETENIWPTEGKKRRKYLERENIWLAEEKKNGKGGKILGYWILSRPGCLEINFNLLNYN